MIRKILFLINKYYWVFVAVIVAISYGQTLLMLPWQDDNALFFKLAHINENAGFMGPGITGTGAYKYTAFFYYPIYLLFKFNPFYYFAFGLFLYFVSTIFIYKIFSKILGVNAGRLAGFLYACGFVGSDSFIRLFNSVVTSISVISVISVVFTYWKYCKDKKIRWYIISLLLFFIGEEFAKARTHYLIVIPILFEILYFNFKKFNLKSLALSILRVALFLPLFNYYVLLADNRSRGAIDYVTSILSGKLYNTYGFFSSIATMILPNALVKYLVPYDYPHSLVSNAIFYLPLQIYYHIPHITLFRCTKR
ncbi:hypothetical protein HY045_01795 [Candidatus Woesebacteria bacterium]|nr:hypothetical protein [Candidatus Woesebacteria bacterium]